MKKNIDYVLLPDIPLAADKRNEAKFGHEQIAEVLTNLVINVNPPFTIGLFGKWGTGKSTILNFIEENLKKEKIKTVIFDVWKYDEDSLRRQFLITLDDQLELKLKYKKVLNQTLSTPYELGLFEDFKYITNHLLTRTNWLLILFLLIMTILGNVPSMPYEWLFKAARDTSFIVFIFTYLLSSINIVYGTTQESKTDSAEGFEDRFYNEVLPKIKSDKLLIIIDNLDRTTHDKAVSLLSDIKTFLGKDKDDNKAIFLIACDEDAIKKHLEKSKFDNPTEFLRKFFNTSIKIPKFLGEELDEYTRDLLKQVKIIDFVNNAELEWLITYAFRDNPREIKQFINTLVTQYLLAKKAEESNQIITNGIVTERIESLAKMLVIRQKFPTAYSGIENMVLDRALLWRDIVVDPSFVYSENFYETNDGDRIANNEKKKFTSFISETKQIDIPHLSIFIRLRQSPQEQKLPGVESFIIAAEGRKIEEAKSVYGKFTPQNLSDLDDILRSRIVSYRRANRIPSIMILSSITINIAEQSLNKLPRFLKELSLSFPKENELLNYLDDFSPKMAIEIIYPLLSPVNKKLFIEAYASLYRLQDNEGKSPVHETYLNELLEITAKNKQLFLPYRSQISSIFEKSLYKYRYIKIFLDNNASEFITPLTINMYSNRIDQSKISDLTFLNENLDLLLKFDLKELMQSVLMRFYNLMETETQQGLRNENRNLLTKFLLRLLNEKTNIEELENLNKNDNSKPVELLSNILLRWYDQDQSLDSKLIFFKIMDILSQVPSNQNKAALENIVNDFISEWSTPETLKQISTERLDDFVVTHTDSFRHAIYRNNDILDIIFPLANLAIAESFIYDLISHNPHAGLSKLKLFLKKISNKIGALTFIIGKLPNLEPQALEEYCNFIQEVIDKNDDGNIKMFYDFLISVKPSKPEFVKKYTNNKFFTKAQRGKLMEEEKDTIQG